MNSRALLEDLLSRRILVLDGAMGTMLGHEIQKPTTPDLLVLTRPSLVTGLHHAYLEAGADIIQTNTFSGTSIAHADDGFGARAYTINVEGARLACAAAHEWSRRTPDRPRFVAGTIGPTSKRLCTEPDEGAGGCVPFDEARIAYRDQVRGLADGGVDLLIIETVFDPLNAQAAIAGLGDGLRARELDLPVMISATTTARDQSTIAGQTVEAFYESICHARPFSVGFNCSLGASHMRPLLAQLSTIATTYISCHPNAGLPNALGDYDEGPREMARRLGEIAVDGLVNIVGGCCGTTPAHIRAIAEAVRDVAPRPVAA